MAEALAADLGQGDFDAALVADDAAVLHALVLAAEALPVGDGSEDAGAEEAVALGLEGAVVDGFRLGDFAVRPAADLFRAGELDLIASKSAIGLVSSNGLERYILRPPSSCHPRSAMRDWLWFLDTSSLLMTRGASRYRWLLCSSGPAILNCLAAEAARPAGAVRSLPGLRCC